MPQRYDIDWLADKQEKGEAVKFIFFWGHSNKNNEEVGKFVFSQWWEAPFVVEGITYFSTEHWMMAKKAVLFQDQEIWEKILAAKKPAEAKTLGREVKNFEEKLWNEQRFDIVKMGNFHKFSQHEKLGEYLLNTNDRVLVEASPVDAIWGIGLAQDHPQVENVARWRGLNLLGFALMEVRDLLRSK